RRRRNQPGAPWMHHHRPDPCRGSEALFGGQTVSAKRRKMMKKRTMTWRAQILAVVAAMAMIVPASGAIADRGSGHAADADGGLTGSESPKRQAETGATFNNPNGSEAEQYEIRDYIQG